MKETDGFGYFSPQLQQKSKELFAASLLAAYEEQGKLLLRFPKKYLPRTREKKPVANKTNNAVPNWMQPNPALPRKLPYTKDEDISLPDRQQSTRYLSYNTETPRSRGEEFRPR